MSSSLDAARRPPCGLCSKADRRQRWSTRSPQRHPDIHRSFECLQQALLSPSPPSLPTPPSPTQPQLHDRHLSLRNTLCGCFEFLASMPQKSQAQKPMACHYDAPTFIWLRQQRVFAFRVQRACTLASSNSPQHLHMQVSAIRQL